MVDFRKKLEDLRARKHVPAAREISEVSLTSTDVMDDSSFAVRGTVPESKQEEPGMKLFCIVVRIADTSDAPPLLTQEITAYNVTNTTQDNYVLKEVGKDTKGRKNLPKNRVGQTGPIIRKSIAVGEGGGIWAAAETWVFGNVGMYVDTVKYDLASALSALRTRARRCTETIEQE